MERSITKFGMGLGLVLAIMPLAACTEGGYGYGVGSTGYSSGYSGWYDGYYGPIYDGYWGSNNYYYYRLSDRDQYRRADRKHFYRGDRAPNTRYQRFDGQTRQAPQGTRMPYHPNKDLRNDRKDRNGHDQRRRDHN